MCIRALDYSPPVDMNFGDYIRALITADRDLVPDDDKRYRVAFLEAFRRRGIYPVGVRNLSTESVCWTSPELDMDIGEGLDKMSLTWDLQANRKAVYETSGTMPGHLMTGSGPRPPKSRRFLWASTGPTNKRLKLTMKPEYSPPLRFTRYARYDVLDQTDNNNSTVFRDNSKLETRAGQKFRGGSTLIIDLEAKDSLRRQKNRRSSRRGFRETKRFSTCRWPIQHSVAITSKKKSHMAANRSQCFIGA